MLALGLYHMAVLYVLGMLIRDPRKEVGIKDKLLRMTVNIFYIHSEKDFLHGSSGMLTFVSITVFRSTSFLSNSFLHSF